MKDLINNKLEQAFNELLDGAVKQKREITLVSAGECMSPLLNKGDLISFKRVDINKLKRTDLIVFKLKDIYGARRFIKTVTNNGQSYIITKSDMSKEYDEPIEEESFMGIITKVEKPNKTNKSAGKKCYQKPQLKI